MTDLFHDDELSSSAELASVALDGELDASEQGALADPEALRRLAEFRTLSTRLADIDEPAPRAVNDAVVAALDAWPREAGVEDDESPLELPRRPHTSVAPATAPRRRSRHPLPRWAGQGIAAVAVVTLVMVVGASVLNRRGNTTAGEAASSATTALLDRSASRGFEAATASTTTVATAVPSAESAGSRAASDTSTSLSPGVVSLGEVATARDALERYRALYLVDTTSQKSAPPATTAGPGSPNPANGLSAPCGSAYVAEASTDSGPVLLRLVTESNGAAYVEAVQPATCAVVDRLALA